MGLFKNEQMVRYNKSYVQGYMEKISRVVEAENYSGYDITGLAQPTTQGTYKDYVKTYSVIPFIYVCVNIVASNGALVDMKVFKRAKDENGNREEQHEHKLLDLLWAPNQWMTKHSLMESTFGNLDLTGNAYWELKRNGAGKIIEIYPLQSQRVKIVPDGKDKVRGYLYQLSTGGDIKFDVNDILHFSYWNPENDFYGLSRIAAAENSIIIDSYAQNYNKYFFKNSARPDAVLQTEQSLTPEMYKRLHKEWNAAHQGVTHAHRIAILEAGLTYKQTALSHKEMDYVIGRKMTREEILAIFIVPPVMAGIYEKSSGISIPEQKRIFWEEGMLPRLEKIEEVIDTQLLPEFDNASDFEFDIYSIEAMRENAESAARISATMVDRGIMKINEARKKYWNLPPVNWGDIWHMPLNLTPVDSGRTAGGDLQNRASGKPTEPNTQIDHTLPNIFKSMSDKLDDYDSVLENAMIKNIDDNTIEKAKFLEEHKKWEDLFAKRLAKIFKKQKNLILNNIKKLELKGFDLREILKKEIEEERKLSQVNGEITPDDTVIEDDDNLIM